MILPARRRSRKLKSEINVVPYIDVMLVLLIIFMATAPMLTLNTLVHLPTSQAKALTSQHDPVVVVVAADGTMALQLPKSKPITMERSDMEAHLKAIATQDASVHVVVVGDRTVPYQKIMDALSLLEQAQIEKVGLISESDRNVH